LLAQLLPPRCRSAAVMVRCPSGPSWLLLLRDSQLCQAKCTACNLIGSVAGLVGTIAPLESRRTLLYRAEREPPCGESSSPGSRSGRLRPQLCLTGKSVDMLSSHVAKKILLSPSGKSLLELPRLVPTQRGVSRSSRTLDMGCGGRGSVGAQS
jgi:hypothetical protein